MAGDQFSVESNQGNGPPERPKEPIAEQAISKKNRNIAKGWHEWIKAVGAIAPVIVSILALTISLLAYSDQHRADQAAAISARQTYATKVSFWTQARTRRSSWVLIENQADAPISNVIIRLIDIDGRFKAVSIGTVPPCAIERKLIHIGIFGVQYLPAKSLLTGVESVAFTDNNGLAWIRSWDGKLKEHSYRNDQFGINAPIEISNDITAA